VPQDNTINVLFFGDVMKINLNGKLVETHCRSLMDLVEEQGLNPTSLIAEYNFEVVKQEFWGHLHIKDKDNIELLSFVGGG
jgi:sulfur carrier protein